MVHQVLYRALLQALGQTEGADPTANLYRELSGTQYLNDVVLVDQSPIGRTPRSNPVTYIKAFDDIRELFAAQPDAKRKGFTAGSFSFNVPGGRCDVCEGDGTVTVEMQFLADIELPCEECNGTRYKASHSRDQVQGQEHPRRAGHDGEGGAGVLCRASEDRGQAVRCWMRSGWGMCGWGRSATTLSRRRGAAGEAGVSTWRRRVRLRIARRRSDRGEAKAREPDAVHPRRADDRAAL